jgi:hypothetical protein
MKKIIVASLLLASIILTSIPALAGYVTIVNNTEDDSCFVSFTGYFIGIPTQMETPCALPGKKEWTHTSLSVGYVKLICGTKNNCGGFKHKLIDYMVPGVWLPHRNFKVTYDGRTREVKVTEEGP